MTGKESSKIKMYGGFEDFLEGQEAIRSSFKPLQVWYLRLVANNEHINSLAKTLTQDLVTYSAGKNNQKLVMAEISAALAGVAYVALVEKNMPNEAAQLHLSVNEYMKLSDTEAKILAKANYDQIEKHMAHIGTDFITAEELDFLKTMISGFDDSHSTSTAVQQDSPLQTKAFKSAIRVQDGVVEEIKLLARKLKTSKPDFYEKLLVASTVQAVAVHHTSLSINVKDKVSGKPIANVTLSLSNSKKTGTSDEAGHISIDQVLSGTVTISLKAAAYADQSLQVGIVKRVDNHLEVSMVPNTVEG